MASVDLLEELKLNDYYPQKLSITEAIHLAGETKDVKERYGIEIVRKILMFDSTAVVSITTELSKSLKNAGKQREDKKVPHDSVGSRSSQKSSVRPSFGKDKSEPTERRFHPMDLLVVVMNCCDDLLRQILVERMFANKLSIPILLPDVRNSSYTLLHLALRSLVPGLQDRTLGNSDSFSDALVDAKTPVVSFIRAGKQLHRSKSKLVNELLSLNAFNTFFHRECPNGFAKRSVSNGSIEAAWFQSEKVIEEEFNCRFFTALNLRGDARHYPKQTQFLCQSSTLVVFMVESFEPFKELCERILKDDDLSLSKIIVCYISTISPQNIEEEYLEFLEDLEERGIISAVIYDWHNWTKKISDSELTNVLINKISELLRSTSGVSQELSTYTSVVQKGKKFGFPIDYDKLEYKTEESSADKFVDLVLKQGPDCKPIILPLQGEPWIKIGELEREQRGNLKDRNQSEYFIASKETEKRRQRQIQCRSLIHQNEVTNTFSVEFHVLQELKLLHYLNSCKIQLDARSRVITSNLLEQFNREKLENQPQMSNAEEPETKLSKKELQIENNTIGLEHILRECGQMYEAVISEESRMREELRKASVTPDVIRNFPTIVARLLLRGHPLELMDGDASNVPITWLKAVLDQLTIVIKNAKVFVLSIIGVQSSGKSTLLNALFGLQFPVSSGRCTRGIYCHLVPVDKGSLQVEYDYILVVDTEGLGSSQFTGKSTFRDNELATFAIGLADATIINMKGENWAEMKDVLQIVAHGLIRIRKTKAELELMPRCMFAHQNVPAADAEEKNRLGQEKQLLHLNKAIKEAANKEDVKEVTKFDDLIKYDPGSHSWYFPDLWNGRPPKARISQDYVDKTNELRQHLVQVMKNSSSKLTIATFFLRMSDLWNAMLHNDFVLSFRNTQNIIAGTVLNDRISHEVDSFKNQNKLEQTKIRDSISSYKSIDEFRVEKERILKQLRESMERNFAYMKATLQGAINATDISSALKEKYLASLSEIKEGELLRINNEIIKDIRVHERKLEYESDERVKKLKARLTDLEKRTAEVEKDKVNETYIEEFEESWQQLIIENKSLVDERKKPARKKIEKQIKDSIAKLTLGNTVHELALVWEDIFKTPLDDKVPQITKYNIVHKDEITKHAGWLMDLVYSNSNVDKANSRLAEAFKTWELRFENQTSLEFDDSLMEKVLVEVDQLFGITSRPEDGTTSILETSASYLRPIMSGLGHIGGLMRFSRDEQSEVPPERREISSNLKSSTSSLGQLGSGVGHEMNSILPLGYSFNEEYLVKFFIFFFHYVYDRSLQNSERLISLTDPLADIEERHRKSVINYQQMSAEAKIDAASKTIFDFAKSSFVRELGELIKAEVCSENSTHPTFKSKRAFLKKILTDLGQKTQYSALTYEEKKNIFGDFMLYVQLGESRESEDFFLKLTINLLKEMLTKKIELKTKFHQLVEDNVGKAVERAIDALRQADISKGWVKEYLQSFKNCMKVTDEIDIRFKNLEDFTEAVVEKVSNLYGHFLGNANSLFEELVREDNTAAVRTVFEKIMGCRERCPFCSAPCSQSLEKHAGDHRANHYPTGVRGTIRIWHWLRDVQETHDLTKEDQRKLSQLALDTCQTLVSSTKNIRTKVTVQKYSSWYHHILNWNYQSAKSYKQIKEYQHWDIPYSGDPKTSLYWKWFMAQFVKELAEYYSALCPKLPPAWEDITWEEAKESLDEPDLNSEPGPEEQC